MADNLLNGVIPLKVKRLYEDSILPTRANQSDAGLDMYVNSIEKDTEKGIVTYNLGVSLEIPEGFFGLLFPRSSVFKYDLSMTNSVGVIDSGYRGEVKAKFRIPDWESKFSKRGIGHSNPELYEIGDRCCQLIILPCYHFPVVDVDSLSDSDRGEGGYGSTGK